MHCITDLMEADVQLEVTAPWAEPLVNVWQNKPLDFDAEKQFNRAVSRTSPHCCICSLFVPFKVMYSRLQIRRMFIFL